MDIVTTSLEALIQRATCSQNQCPDNAAIDAFCGLVNREPESAPTAARFITAKVQSLQEWEALQALHVLDSCMKRCGSCFHTEVGKFRFLNELIKLVSPKYLGAHTPDSVRHRVLELMYAWTQEYPRETKIREAYDMLKQQGVIKEERNNHIHEGHKGVVSQSAASVFHDEEKSRQLQKLLQSKNPDDLQAANRLIKTMVKEDERRVEMKSRHMSELEAVQNNARLLGEMLASYRVGPDSEQDLELINELHTSCLRFRPTVFKMAADVQPDDPLFGEVLAANDELGLVCDKYTSVIVNGHDLTAATPPRPGTTLLDLSTPNEEALPPPVTPLHQQLSDLGLDFGSELAPAPIATVAAGSKFAALGDIFGSVPTLPSVTPFLPPTGASLYPAGPMLQPGLSCGMPMLHPAQFPVSSVATKTDERSSLKGKGLKELDVLGESLLKEHLPESSKLGVQFNKSGGVKVSMNQLSLQKSASVPSSPLHSPVDTDLETAAVVAPVNGDDCMLNLDERPQLEKQQEATVRPEGAVQPLATCKEVVVKPISDITVALESIKPSSVPPLNALEEGNGLCVMLHLAKDTPRPDISVFVVTTTSKNQAPLTDYLFQPVVPKTCRLRLQHPSCTSLPVHNPFLPPAAITQVMLIASPSKEPIALKFVISYTMEGETITEMAEIERLPLTTT